MKSWLLKFKISSALDDRKPLPPTLESAINRSEEARRFAADSKTLEQRLKQQLPKPQAPPSLHSGIMRSVRAAAHAPEPDNQISWMRWIPVSALALLVVLGALAAIHFSPNHVSNSTTAKPAPPPSLATAGSALELGSDMLRDAPAAAMSPLVAEARHLNTDLTNAKEFLLATLP
jgi:hypothetical protein